MLDQFLAAVGGPTRAAQILGVSGAAVHNWTRGKDVSTKMQRRIGAWMTYNSERERFVLRNVWAQQDRVWSPPAEEYAAWLESEFNHLAAVLEMPHVLSFWTEVTT